MAPRFNFKKFTVRQEISAMKVNTDAVLLGSWARFPKEKKQVRLLDVGTGTGVIALMMAQRLQDAGVEFDITGIDPDNASYTEAAFNFGNSPWQERLHTKEITLQKLVTQESKESYDLIVSNPPFFTASLKAPTIRRTISRHNDTLPFRDIIVAAKHLLKSGGMLSLILPAGEAETFRKEARGMATVTEPSLFLTRICSVRTTAHKPVKRVMMEFAKLPENISLTDIGGCKEENLVIYELDGVTKSSEYRDLTSDFYLDTLFSPPLRNS
ncbi:MAG: methyltransferase domain-containing protein [Bacteroidia bacterium]|nr:methyltransferase domain-containing protein [Bacteroidia bacterium]